MNFKENVAKISSNSIIVKCPRETNSQNLPSLIVHSTKLSDVTQIFKDIGLIAWRFETACDNYLVYMDWIRKVFKKLELQIQQGDEKTGETFTLVIGGQFYSRNHSKHITNDVKLINKVTRELSKNSSVQKKQIDKCKYIAYGGR